MIQKAIDEIKSKDYLLITAGAGMGVDSGLPDFRGKEGFWRAYPKAKELGLNFADLANPSWFRNDPRLAWAFYGDRLNLYRKTTPHLGFKLLLEIAKDKKDYFVVTSNVDGQFQKAGFSESKIDEIHGSIHYLQCINGCKRDIWSAKDIKIDIDYKSFQAKEPLPKCPHCTNLARPNILMFGDFEWIEDRESKQRENLQKFLSKVDFNNLSIIEFGAGTAVATIRYFSQQMAKEFGAKLIRVNPRDYHNAPISLKLGAKEAIEKIYDGYFNQSHS